MKLRLLWILAFSLAAWTQSSAETRTVARSGTGRLDEIDGQLVLHLAGTPREMGLQHGQLLKEHATKNLKQILHKVADHSFAKIGPIDVRPREAIMTILSIQKEYVPPAYFEELEGLAEGAGLDVNDVRIANFLPELFHCSGFALTKSATAEGKLLHGRVLDYATDWGLQEHAVIIVASPKDGIPFVNISYAGFVGCVTGMNIKGISVGEMGGRGLGHWKGVPMALLVREVLQKSNNLDEAIAVFRDSPRTCVYYYVVADGHANKAVGMEASWNKFELVQPGGTNIQLPEAVPDCVLLSAGDRYQELVKRTRTNLGKLTPENAIRLMDRGVAMKSNLHNVLFEPETTRFWVSNAGTDHSPAAEQPYHEYCLKDLLKLESKSETAQAK